MSPPFDLIEKYFDAELSSEEERALEEWLRADREHLRVFFREVHLSQGMRDLSLHFEADAEKEQRREPLHEDAGRQSAGWSHVRGALAGLANHWRWPALAGAFAVLFVAGVWLSDSPCHLTATSNGGVFLRRRDSEQVVYGEVKLHSGDIIRTESSARAMVRYDRETTKIEVGGGTTVEINQMRRTKLVRLNGGTLYATVAHQRLGSGLEFISPRARAKVLGTDLKLLSRPDRTELEVYSGRVFLGRAIGSEGIQVGAGSSGLVAEGTGISTNSTPSASGWILCEYWHGIPGATIADLIEDARFAADSDLQSHPKNFETPPLLVENYGARVRGYLHPPQTGDYTFWITGDDAAELWLSTDDQPEARQRLCYTASFTGLEQWEKYPTQRSLPVHLIGGRKYYIEALLKQAGGSDGLAVAWQRPGDVRQIVGGAYLSPVTEQK